MTAAFTAEFDKLFDLEPSGSVASETISHAILNPLNHVGERGRQLSSRLSSVHIFDITLSISFTILNAQELAFTDSLFVPDIGA